MLTIKGVQKLTLLDYPEKCAATVFLSGCNLRCPFCHNASLVVKRDNFSVSQEEFFAFLKTRKGILDGVAVTGGEPLINGDIYDFIKKIKDDGFLVKLDTNGTFPDKLERLIQDGLIDYVAMDIKNSFSKYSLTVGVSGFDISPIKKSVALLLSGVVDYEFRTTVAHELFTEGDFVEIAQEIRGAKRYFLQPFADSGDILSGKFTPPAKAELDAYAEIVAPYVLKVSVRG